MSNEQHIKLDNKPVLVCATGAEALQPGVVEAALYKVIHDNKKVVILIDEPVPARTVLEPEGYPEQKMILTDIVRPGNKPSKGGGHLPFIRSMPKLSRNQPCTCGSGKKYKNCCIGK